jgi:hypothetical protein
MCHVDKCSPCSSSATSKSLFVVDHDRKPLMAKAKEMVVEKAILLTIHSLFALLKVQSVPITIWQHESP